MTSADIAALGDTVQISDYQSDGTVKVDAVISGQSKIDLAKKACSVTSLSSGALRVEFEGGLVGTAQLVCNTPTLCTASKVLPASTFTKTGRVQAYICGTIVAQKTILISN